MRRWPVAVFVVILQVAALAQFPYLRTLEVRPGQQRPSITCIAQDAQGLLWAGADIGLLRTDGERVDILVRTEGDAVTAVAASNGRMLAVLESGVLLDCNGYGCDTLLNDPSLRGTPVRSIAVQADGSISLATYGAGVRVLRAGISCTIGAGQGLPDDHVNDLAVLPDGRLAVATDQGLAICKADKVVETFDGSRGAPDNLVLSVSVTEAGDVWAGTDQRGVFRWRPGQDGVHLLDSAWCHGPVMTLAVHGDMVWAATEKHGVVLHDIRYRQASYRQHMDTRSVAAPYMDLLIDREGATWWCDGSDRLYRADPAILFVPEHEGLDLRAITALCTDAQDRIWFATAKGLFRHAAAFSEELQVTRVPLELDPRTPIVSLCAAEDGTIWAASFGSGVFSISPNGKVHRFTTADGLSNDNVLAIRSEQGDVWCATLEGLSFWWNGRFQAVAREAGFVFDVLPEADGSVLMATDGHGVMRWDTVLTALSTEGPRTFYSLVRDATGDIWAAGPGTGLCRVPGAGGLARCVGEGRVPFDGDLYAVGNSLGRMVAFGSTGVAAYDPITGAWTDLAAHFGLQDMQAQLNVIATDAMRSIWIGCNKGLVRIRPTEHHFDPEVPVIITGVLVDGVAMPVSDEIRTVHDRNDITVRFTGLYYTDPAALRFEYRMANKGPTVLRTRDREATFSGLPPGTHRFQVRAFIGEPTGSDTWYTLTIVVEPPWWRLTWVIALAGLLLVSLFVLLVRARDRRVRYRERMEKEQVRFQLETLRSQVDPHFLFNSFNTLVELIEDQPSKAVEHVDQLSTFFRNILLVRDKDLHTLEEELRLLGTYFALEQRRFGPAIALQVQVPEVYRRMAVVPLTLQLLVENALKHNVAVAEAPLVIRVEIVSGMLVVSNPIIPRLTPPHSTGFGLDSILKRYAAFSDRPIDVSKADGVFRVRIPLIDPIP